VCQGIAGEGQCGAVASEKWRPLSYLVACHIELLFYGLASPPLPAFSQEKWEMKQVGR